MADKAIVSTPFGMIVLPVLRQVVIRAANSSYGDDD